jgi:hypothetical protein
MIKLKQHLFKKAIFLLVLFMIVVMGTLTFGVTNVQKACANDISSTPASSSLATNHPGVMAVFMIIIIITALICLFRIIDSPIDESDKIRIFFILFLMMVILSAAVYELLLLI